MHGTRPRTLHPPVPMQRTVPTVARQALALQVHRFCPTASRSPISSCFVGMVSTGRLSRGRFPAFRTGQIANPTAKTCRQDRHRQRDRHGSKFAFRFHQGCEKLTQSTAPQSGQESLKAVSRAKMRRVRQRGFRSGTFASGCPSPQRPPKAKSATAKCVRLPSGAEQGRLRI